jgi:hypothetical protein
MSHCSGVTPGGKDALACLQRNAASLSPGCRSAVGAIGAPAPAAAAVAAPAVAMPAEPPAGGPSPEKLKAVKFTCRGDFGRYCKGVPQGGPEAMGCLQRNAPRLSANCKTALADIADELPPPGATAVVAPPAGAPPVAARPKAPVADAVVMLRACKLDLIRHCRGIPIGTESACLTAHEAGLTVRCRMARKITSPLR